MYDPVEQHTSEEFNLSFLFSHILRLNVIVAFYFNPLLSQPPVSYQKALPHPVTQVQFQVRQMFQFEHFSIKYGLLCLFFNTAYFSVYVHQVFSVDVHQVFSVDVHQVFLV